MAKRNKVVAPRSLTQPPKKRKPWRKGRPAYLPAVGFEAILVQRMAGRKGTGYPYFCPAAKCFMRSVRGSTGLPREARLTGLSGPLAEAFFPDYRLPAGESGGGGREGGRRVHLQLATYYHVDRDTEPREAMARNVIHAFEREGLEVVQCELPACFEKLGTAADFLLRDRRTGQYYVAELKTGMKHAFNGHHTREEVRLAGGLEAYLSCPMHHALLQALATLLMVHETYPGAYRAAKPLVVLAHDEGVDLYHVRDERKLTDFTHHVAAWLRRFNQDN